MADSMNLRVASSQAVKITDLSAGERVFSGSIEETAGRRLLMKVNGPITRGSAIKIEWDRYTVLAEFEGPIQWNDGNAAVARAEQVIARNAQSPSSESGPAAVNDGAAAISRLLFALRTSAINLNEDAYRRFQSELTCLENRLSQQSDAVPIGDVCNAAISASGRYRQQAVKELSSCVTELRSLTNMLTHVIAMQRSAEQKTAEMVGKEVFESLMRLDYRFNNLLQDLAV